MNFNYIISFAPILICLQLVNLVTYSSNYSDYSNMIGIGFLRVLASVTLISSNKCHT
jgi:hypothetical protein